MPQRHGALAVVACLISGMAGPVLQAAQPSRPSIVELLDRYEKRDFEAPVTLAGASADDAEEIARELEEKGTAWTSAKGAPETPGRRLIAATFALDVARVWSVNKLDGRRWQSTRRLLAWGCAELRRNVVAPEGERWWHLAAIALFEGRADTGSLIGEDVPLPASARPLADGPRGHLPHALARFPNEPRFRLAQIKARDFTAWRVDYVGRSDSDPRTGALPPEIGEDDIAELIRAAPVDRFAAQRLRDVLARVERLRETRRLYEELLDADAIGGEVRLRLALVVLKLGDRETGLDHLKQAEALLTDPALLHVTWLMTGSALERMNRPQEALVPYQRALDVAPGARTASLVLTSLLIREGRVQDAARIADQMLSHPQAIDPLSQFGLGNSRFVFDCLERLKQALP